MNLKNILLVFWTLFGIKFNSWADTSILFVLPFIFYFKSNTKTLTIIIASIFYLSISLYLVLYSNIIDLWHIGQPIKSIITLLGIFGMLRFYFGNSIMVKLIMVPLIFCLSNFIKIKKLHILL